MNESSDVGGEVGRIGGRYKLLKEWIQPLRRTGYHKSQLETYQVQDGGR